MLEGVKVMNWKYPAVGFLIILCGFAFGDPIGATVSQLSSPDEILSPQRITFEGYPNETPANTLFQGQGLLFSRDDAEAIYILDWSSLGRVTTSPRNVLATTSVYGANSRWATHLNIRSSVPLFAIGAYFGNDQSDPDYSLTRLSVYGLSDQLLGSVEIPVNNNVSVDQFIGIQSDEPFLRVRIENFETPQTPSDSYSVVLDDLVFSNVKQSLMPIPILIDIKPGSSANPVNVKSRGTIPIAILGSEAFNVVNVDRASLRFGPNGGLPLNGPGLVDANDDGFVDLVLHFDLQESGITCGMESAKVSGSLVTGELIEGVDSIRTEGCNPVATTERSLW
jgi:hypothetical protein